MTFAKAKYLLRFDDLCPTMNWEVWSEIERLLVEVGCKPILAVVPDNQDPKLQVAPPAQDFWERVRQWQAWGWPIALHGFQHKYVTHHPGIVTPRKKSEFAGLPPAVQEEKLRRGVEIFQREGIRPRVWVAPSNSFDAATVSLLPGLGIRIVCDGYFRFPFLGLDGVVWLPQQLYEFRPAPPGVWTVCFHHNGWSPATRQSFRQALECYGSDIASLEETLPCESKRQRQWPVRLYTCPRLSKWMIRAELKLWNWRFATMQGIELGRFCPPRS